MLVYFSDTEEQVPEPQVKVVPMMASNTGWEQDPIEVNWGIEEEPEREEEEQNIVPEPKEAIFKCTALYSYTVSICVEIVKPHFVIRIL